MDKITKALINHKEVLGIFDSLYEHLSSVSVDKSPEYIKKLHGLLHRDIAIHFKFEEEQIFAAIKGVGGQETEKMVNGLLNEHKAIINKIKEFEDESVKAGPPWNADKLREISELGRNIIDMITVHARREDEEFFPLVKKLNVQFNNNDK
ncbi:MAG: hemerythrin domain-containing protein [Candidatus Omnitrophica bacterium]|nr:hemerythrin domain-containing protein [Candidatus Omnitrophota bacterium]